MRHFNYRKLAIGAIALFGTIGAYSQNMYDAMVFSRNEYYGTARSMALGNAVSAVGGDLGTVGINPAGSAIATYGQFTITPSLSMSAVNSSFSPDGVHFDNPISNKYNKLTLPNIGVSFVINTENRTGLRSLSFAVIRNQTSQYNNYAQAFGENPYSSKMGEFASAAGNLSEDLLSDRNAYGIDGIPWDIITAYQGGMIGTFGDQGYYAGLSEAISADNSYVYLPAPLRQTSVTQKYGSKGDWIFNIGANISDKIFVGFNLGIPTLDYGYTEQFYEAASNPELFPIIYNTPNGGTNQVNFKNASYEYRYFASGAGIYAKLGLIVMPVKGLRLSAAIQSPTLFTINETWQHSTKTRFSNSSFDGSAQSPEGSYDYTLRTPYSANFGAALTLGSFALLSFDYELTDYSVMRFSEVDPRSYLQNPFSDLNEVNKLFAGASSTFRFGAEIRLGPKFSIRGGLGTSNCPEFHWTDSDGYDVTASSFLANDEYLDKAISLINRKRYEDITKYASFGFGYSSDGSFFADFAFTTTTYPQSLFSPYHDYVCQNKDGHILSVDSARIHNSRKLMQAAITIGWRF